LKINARNSEHGTNLSGKNLRFAVVVSDFNAPITESLLTGCREALLSAGVKDKDLRVVWVPGAFELPLACLTLARTRRYAAVIALGCVIRGETPHDRYICRAVSQGIIRAGLDTGVPVIFGVLTTLDEKQAHARSGRNDRNKGMESALAALRMARLMKEKPF
jgi:6,7-dimethyl-8-ribityllumazine synthase